jgi:hypothetical protein
MSTQVAMLIAFGIFCAVLLVAVLLRSHVRGAFSFYTMTLELEATDCPPSAEAREIPAQLTRQ